MDCQRLIIPASKVNIFQLTETYAVMVIDGGTQVTVSAMILSKN